MNENNKFVRFDWAAKRMLRDKANFGVLDSRMANESKYKIKNIIKMGIPNGPPFIIYRFLPSNRAMLFWISFIKTSSLALISFKERMMLALS